LAQAGAGAPVFSTKTVAEAYSPDTAPDFIKTAGYSAAGDGGGALYKKVTSEPSHAGKFSITLSDGETVVWYELTPESNGAYNVLAFGVKNDGTDSTTELTAAFDSGFYHIHFPPGRYVWSADIVRTTSVRVTG